MHRAATHGTLDALTGRRGSAFSSNALDPERIAPLVRVPARIIVVTAIMWSTLLLASLLKPQFFPQQLAGLGFAQEIQQRVDGAVATVAAEPNTSICVIVGFSGGQEGIDIEQLAAEDGAPTRYLGLCGACDGTMVGLSELARPFFASDLVADHVVFAVSPFHLVVRPFTPSVRRTDIKHSIDLRLLAGRRRVLEGTNHSTDPRYRQGDPWRPMTKNYFHALPHVQLTRRIEEYGRRGYFDLPRYDVKGRQTKALSAMIFAAGRRGAKVTLVLMPTHPELLSRLPAGATERLLDRLESRLDGAQYRVLDYQDALPSQFFHDVSHLNLDGRRQFTSILVSSFEKGFDSID